MRKFAAMCGTAVVLMFSTFAQPSPDNWKNYSNNEGNFAVLFPGEPQDSVNASDSQIVSHTLMVQDAPAIYMVVYSKMSNPQRVDDANYALFKEGVLKELPKCGVDSEKAPVPMVNGFVGHSYQLTCEMQTRLTIQGNLYWGKRHAYAVMVMYPTNGAQPAGARKFIESFSVLNAD